MGKPNHRRGLVLSLFGLSPRRIGGTERYCWELSQALHAHGWHSVLGFEGKPHALVNDYLQLPNVSVETIPSLTTGGMETLVAIYKLIRTWKPDIVHLHYTGFVTPYPWLARLLGVRHIYLTNHASYPEGFEPRQTSLPKRLLYQLINSPLRGVVCPSDFGRRCLAKTGVLSEQRYQVIYNSTHLVDPADVDLHFRRFRVRYRIPDDRVIITQVGQLIPEKGVDDLLAAFRIAAAENNQLHLVLVGDGPCRLECEQKISEWSLSSRVTLTGLIEDVADAGVFEACDICCLVSRWEELFGFVLVEGMARGRPVVATRVGGIPEVVASGETGFLVERGDVEGMARHFLDLALSPTMRRNLGSAGRGRVADLFDVRKNTLQVIRMYGIA